MTGIDKFSDFLNENSQIKFSFSHAGKNITFQEKTKKSIFIKAIDWLSQNAYDFENKTGQSYYPNILEVIPSGHRLSHYYKITNINKFIDINFIKQFQGLISLLLDFGIKKESIHFDNVTGDIENNELVEKIKVFKKNPFRQSICVLGESGAGKSVTIENILESEGHNFEYIIPTAATTGLLAQFSPSKSGYVSSRLGRMLIEASKNPQELYTVVFDEMHKSNVIEMINDELLQAISTKRNNGIRFISLDDDTAEIYAISQLDTIRGNLIIPDNFGFIFISSKPKVISNNTDFFNRVDIVVLKSYEEETIATSDELLIKVLPFEEKMKLVSTRND